MGTTLAISTVAELFVKFSLPVCQNILQRLLFTVLGNLENQSINQSISQSVSNFLEWHK